MRAHFYIWYAKGVISCTPPKALKHYHHSHIDSSFPLLIVDSVYTTRLVRPFSHSSGPLAYWSLVLRPFGLQANKCELSFPWENQTVVNNYCLGCDWRREVRPIGHFMVNIPLRWRTTVVKPGDFLGREGRAPSLVSKFWILCQRIPRTRSRLLLVGCASVARSRKEVYLPIANLVIHVACAFSGISRLFNGHYRLGIRFTPCSTGCCCWVRRLFKCKQLNRYVNNCTT